MFFVEIGSCDFDTCEELILNNWKGIVVEPVKYYFDKLKKYDNIIYENIAISDSKKTLNIHYIDPDYINKNLNNRKWLKGISCLNGDKGCFIFNHNKKLNIFKNSLKQEVNCLTLQNLCDKYSINNINFLKIDTEGHDFIILQSLDIKKVNVDIIKIEHKHSSCDKIFNFLNLNNFYSFIEKDDIYAVNKNLTNFELNHPDVGDTYSSIDLQNIDFLNISFKINLSDLKKLNIDHLKILKINQDFDKQEEIINYLREKKYMVYNIIVSNCKWENSGGIKKDKNIWALK